MQRWLCVKGSKPWSLAGAWKWLAVHLAVQTPWVGQSVNQSRGGRRQPVLSVSLCVSDPCDFRMVFAVQPDPSGLNKLDTLGARLGCRRRCPHCDRLSKKPPDTLTRTCSGSRSLSLAYLSESAPVGLIYCDWSSVEGPI